MEEKERVNVFPLTLQMTPVIGAGDGPNTAKRNPNLEVEKKLFLEKVFQF